MLTEEELQKKWESLTFTDDFIFSRVMHNETICRQVVELILGVRIGKISSCPPKMNTKLIQIPCESLWMYFCEMKTALSQWKCRRATRRNFPNGAATTRAWQTSAPPLLEQSIEVYQTIFSFLSVPLILLIKNFPATPSGTLVMKNLNSS